MKISATEAGQAETALLSLEADGSPGRWWLFDPDGVIVRGEAGQPVPAARRAILAVPGERVSIHWLELSEGMTRPQAAAAARLLLADTSVEPMSGLHVAVGQSEKGRTPVALVSADEMRNWLVSAEAVGIDPAAMIPTSALLVPPEEGYSSWAREDVSDYRAEASAFSLEPALARHLLGDAQPISLSLDEFEAGLPAILSQLPLDLRQGPFARRRNWIRERDQVRRIVGLAFLLFLLSLALQVALILRYTFAADALEAEAQTLSAPGSAGRPSFSTVAGALFAAVQSTPNVELTSLEYQPDGSLAAGIVADSAATLEALDQRVQASGLDTSTGPVRNAGGRPAADLTVRR